MNSNQSFIVSTETRKHAINRYGAYLFFLVLGVAVATMPLWIQWFVEGPSEHHPPVEHEPLMDLLCLGFGLTLFLGVCGFLYFQRGEWEFDAEGICWKPLGRKERYLRWRDVDRVDLNRRRKCRIRSNSTVIGIHWHNWPKEDRLRGIEIIEEKLGPHFPFEEQRKRFRKIWKFAYARIIVSTIVVGFSYALLRRAMVGLGGQIAEIVFLIFIFGPFVAYGCWELRRLEKKCWVWRKTLNHNEIE